MLSLIIAIHVLICILLIGIILVQAGRGGGLVEGFSGVESMFGTKTNTFLTRTTTVLSTLFFLTCVGLALLSAKQSHSLMRDAKEEKAAVVPTQVPPQAQTQNATEEKKSEEVPKTE